MRKIIFFISVNKVRKEGIIHKTYQTYLEMKMPKMKALISISPLKEFRRTAAISEAIPDFEPGNIFFFTTLIKILLS